MDTLTFPGSARYIGMAIDPADESTGLSKAVAALGETRIREIVEQLVVVGDQHPTAIIGTIASDWRTSAPLGSALAALTQAGPITVMTCAAARLLADRRGDVFNKDALDLLAPAIRTLAGLPSAAEVAAAMAAAA